MHQDAIVKERGVPGTRIESIEGAAFDPIGATGGHHCRNEEVIRKRVVRDVVAVEVSGSGVDHPGVHRAVVVEVDLHIEGVEDALWRDPLAGGRQSEEDACGSDVTAGLVGGCPIGQQVGRSIREGQVARWADASQLEDTDQSRGLLAGAEGGQRHSGRPRSCWKSDPQGAGMGRGQRSDDGVPGHMDGDRPAMKPQLTTGFWHLGSEAGPENIRGGRVIADAHRAGLETEGDGHFLARGHGDLIEQGHHSGRARSHCVAGGDVQGHGATAFVRQSDSALLGVGSRQFQGSHGNGDLIAGRGVARDEWGGQRIDHGNPAGADPGFGISHTIRIGRVGGCVHESRLDLECVPGGAGLSHQGGSTGDMGCGHGGSRHGDGFGAQAGARGGNGTARCGDVWLEAAGVGDRPAGTGVVEPVGQFGSDRGGAGFEGDEEPITESSTQDGAVGPGDHHARNLDVTGVSGSAHGNGKSVHIIDHHHGHRTGLLSRPHLAGKEAGAAVDEGDLALHLGSIGDAAVITILAGVQGLGGDDLCGDFAGDGDGVGEHAFDGCVFSDHLGGGRDADCGGC